MRTLMLSWILLLYAIVGAGTAHAATLDHAHGQWAALLARHVHWNAAGTTTSVDYAGFVRDRDRLDRYLASLRSVPAGDFRRWPKADRDAFLINAYNAATVQLVLTRYPRLQSIKQLGGLLSSPWKKPFVELLGKRRSLDDIEHRLLRGAADYRDPRIHFAVNCASIGCPALRPEAYTGAKLDVQLDDQTRRFLRDRSRNRHDASAKVMRVSRIFDWYGDDFSAHSGGISVFLARYPAELGVDSGTEQSLRQGRIPMQFLDYDWSLNRSRP